MHPSRPALSLSPASLPPISRSTSVSSLHSPPHLSSSLFINHSLVNASPRVSWPWSLQHPCHALASLPRLAIRSSRRSRCFASGYRESNRLSASSPATTSPANLSAASHSVGPVRQLKPQTSSLAGLAHHQTLARLPLFVPQQRGSALAFLGLRWLRLKVI